MQKSAGKRLILLAPWMKAKASVIREEVETLERRGFQRLRVNGEIKRLDQYDLIPTDTKGKEITVELVIDRLAIKDDSRSRLADSLELAFEEGSERAIALIEEKNGEWE